MFHRAVFKIQNVFFTYCPQYFIFFSLGIPAHNEILVIHGTAIRHTYKQVSSKTETTCVTCGPHHQIEPEWSMVKSDAFFFFLVKQKS